MDISKNSLSQLQQQEGNYQIIAPLNGVVNEIYAEKGSFVSPGTPIFQLVDITKVILNLSINQEMVPYLRIGHTAEVTTDVYPDVVFDGVIVTKNVQADVSQKISIGVSVQNTKEHPILAGMYGKAVFLLQNEKGENLVLAIPRAAIVGSIQDAKVYIVESDNTVSLRHVTTGKIIDTYVEVTGGLVEGDQVVTAGQINLEEGKEVTIKN